ncbi:MAG: integration host factor subunit alpha [Mariprofundaceae bacterium]|nr:integration host factor subunit alpha [Mariprofundaceae bacterium]
MTKADIAHTIQQHAKLNKTTSIRLIDSIFNHISHTLITGENVKISGFGHFIVREKSARMGRNPKTGEAAEISARRVVTFRPSQAFKQVLLEKGESD